MHERINKVVRRRNKRFIHSPHSKRSHYYYYIYLLLLHRNPIHRTSNEEI